MEKCRNPRLDLSATEVGDDLDLALLLEEAMLWAGDGAGRFPLSLTLSQSDIAGTRMISCHTTELAPNSTHRS